jgi:hypothetical protein
LESHGLAWPSDEHGPLEIALNASNGYDNALQRLTFKKE